MLKYGDNNFYVAYLKVRLNNIRAGLIGAGNGCPWGPNTTGNLFDDTLWLNVGCFQQTYHLPITYTYVANGNPDLKMRELETLLDIHY